MSKVVLAVGGTGGHIVPALECAREIKCETYFIGVKASEHHLLQGFPSVFSIDGASLSLRKGFVFSLVKIFKGFYQSLQLLQRIRPKVVVGFGSYHSFPPLLAALVLRIPIILYEPNAKMGRVNRLVFPLAKKVAMYFPGSHKKMIFIPITAKEPKTRKEQARLDYGLSRDRTTILVFGGSQGAQILNQIVPYAVMGHNVQVIHLTGFKDSPEEVAALYEQHDIKAIVKPFEEEMYKAYLCSDLAICRAGASTLKELIGYALPAILVPYPHAMDNHQLLNAQYFTDIIRGGIYLPQDQLSPEQLSERIQKMFSEMQKYESHLLDFQISEKGDSLATIIHQLMK